MRKLISVGALIALSSGMLVAQSDQPATATDTGRDNPGVTRIVTPHKENNWGLLGLIGLVGLAGLRRKPAVIEEHRPVDIRRVA